MNGWQSSERSNTSSHFLVVVDREQLQLSKAAFNRNHSLQLIVLSKEFLKAGEMPRHNQCFLIAVIVKAHVTDNLTCLQILEIESAECL